MVAHPALLQVPLEHLRRVVKDRKHIAEQLRATSSELKGLAGSKHSSAACSQTLDRIISKVQRLQRKARPFITSAVPLCHCGL